MTNPILGTFFGRFCKKMSAAILMVFGLKIAINEPLADGW